MFKSLIYRLKFSKEEREILQRAERTSHKAHRQLYGFPKKTAIAILLVAILSVATTYAILNNMQTVNQSLRIVGSSASIKKNGVLWATESFGDMRTSTSKIIGEVADGNTITVEHDTSGLTSYLNYTKKAYTTSDGSNFPQSLKDNIKLYYSTDRISWIEWSEGVKISLGSTSGLKYYLKETVFASAGSVGITYSWILEFVCSDEA